MSSVIARLLVVTTALLISGAIVPPPARAEITMARPVVEPRLNGTLDATTIPIRVSWPRAPSTGSSVSRYTLEQSVDGGAWNGVRLSRPLARAVVVRSRPWRAYQFRVRATFTNGETTGWGLLAQPLWLAYANETDLAASYGPGWALQADGHAHRKARMTASAAGAAVTFSFTGTHVAWVSRYGPDRGRARVYVNGGLVATVDLRRATVRHHRVAFRRAWSTVATRTLRIELEGTSGRPRGDIDAFVVLTPPHSQTIVGAGDIGRCGTPNPEKTAQLVEAISGIVYTTGDNAYLDGSAADFANCYDPSWGRFRSRTRPSPGNHDYDSPGAAPYYAYFGANAGPAGKGWYTYQAGTWRIYSLNSENCRAINDFCAAGSAQYDWLKADLAADPHSCVLAYWHRPRYSSGYHGGSTRMANITRLLYDNGADVVLAGHDHDYERLEPVDPAGQLDAGRGIRHFVIGTGGAALYKFEKPPLAITAVRANSVHGVLRLDLHPGRYDWQFVPTADVFTDSGSGTCH